MKIEVVRDYYKENEFIYDKDSVDLKTGLTVLVGCNGNGKTTLLYQIKYFCENKNIPFVYYNNLTDGDKGNNLYESISKGDISEAIQEMISSEGELIYSNISKLANKIGKFINNHLDSDKIFILLDAIDSGLSIDNILELKSFFNLVINDNKSREIYIITACNEYELARNQNCLEISSLEYIDIPTYEDYRKIIISSRKKKNIRYKWSEFDLE